MQLRLLIYPVFLLVCFLTFQSTKDYGYVTDYLGWLNRYRDSDFSDVWNCFGYPGMHQFFHLINFILYKLIGKNVAVMGTVFILTHASVCYLVYRTFRLILEAVNPEHAGLIALFTGIFTALSPYAIEPITWDACFHYLLCTGLVFFAINFLTRYHLTKKNPFLYLHFLFFILALFTIELALVAPAIFLIYLSLVVWASGDVKQLAGYWYRLVPIYVVLLVAYFILTKLSIGTWIGHYGAEQHLKLSPTLLITTFAKYLSKILLLSHFWKFTYKESWYTALSELWKSLAFLFAIGLLVAMLYRTTKYKKLNQVLIASVVAFVFGLLPILNLFFVWIGWYENDRYSYFAAPHMYLFVTTLFFIAFKKTYAYVWILFLVLNAFFLSKMIRTTRDAGTIVERLCQDFDYYDYKEVVLLCVPENLNGAYLFRDYGNDGVTFNESLDWLGKRSYTGKMTNISEINLTSTIDSVGVQITSPKTIKVNIASWGSWFWRKGAGLSGSESDRYKVVPGDLSFEVTVKDSVPGRIFIFNKGEKWQSVQLPGE